MNAFQTIGQLEQLRERRLESPDMPVIFIDGIEIGPQSAILAIGLADDGSRRVLGIQEGTSRSPRAVQGLLDDIVRRGLSLERRRLYVVAGSMLVRNAVLGMFGDAALIQRCRDHCLRDVVAPLDEAGASALRVELERAFQLPWDRARTAIELLASDVRDDHPIVAANLLESIHEDLTVNQLDLPEGLAKRITTTEVVVRGDAELQKALEEGVPTEEAEFLETLAGHYLGMESRLEPLDCSDDIWLLDAAMERACIEDTYGNRVKPDPVNKSPWRKHRRHKRWSIRNVHGTVQCTVAAKIVDVSLHGAAVETRTPLTIGREYAFSLISGPERLDLRATVKWCRLSRAERQASGESTTVFSTGIEFAAMLTPEGEGLMDFLEDHVEILLERRIFGRFHLDEDDTRVRLDSSFPFVVRMISASGMSIETDLVPDVDVVLPFELRLGEKTLHARGKVVHVDAGKPGEFGQLGIEFVECDREGHEVLEQFIGSELVTLNSDQAIPD